MYIYIYIYIFPVFDKWGQGPSALGPGTLGPWAHWGPVPGTTHLGPGALGGADNLRRRLVEHPVIERLEANAYVLTIHLRSNAVRVGALPSCCFPMPGVIR